MRTIRLGPVLLLAGTVLPAAATAQSVNDFKLPQGTATPATAPRTTGPADPDQVVVLPRPRPSASASPASTATAPSLSLPVSPAQPAASAPAATAPRPAPQRRAPAPASGSQAARPAPAATSAPPPPPGAALALPDAAPVASTAAAEPGFSFGQPAAPVAATPPADEDGGWNWWAILAVLGTAAAAAFAALWWRQRQDAPLAITFEPPVVRNAGSDAAPAEPTAPPEAPPAPQPGVPPPPAPEVPPAPVEPEPAPAPVEIPPESLAAVAAAAAVGPLALALEARRLSASLMATTLTYRLVLTNTGVAPLSAVAIEGDMIGAHASLPPEQQLANRSENLELRHAAVSLAPGESVEFNGDLRLPLAAITPIRAGNAAYFVPLARFRVEASNDAGDQQVAIQTFVVGDQGEDPASPLRPFRLDLGPRTYSRIGQRAVA